MHVPDLPYSPIFDGEKCGLSAKIWVYYGTMTFNSTTCLGPTPIAPIAPIASAKRFLQDLPERTFKYKDGSNGHLAICRKDNHVMGHPFRPNDASQFIRALKSNLKAIWSSQLAKGDEGGKYNHLADVLQLCGNASKPTRVKPHTGYRGRGR